MKTIQDRIAGRDKNYYDVSPVEQKKYLYRLGEAINDFDRSFKQYRAQFYYKSKFNAFLLNISSVPLLIGILPYYIVKGLFVKKDNEIEAISRIKESEHCEPDSLLKQYNINRTHWNEKGAIHFKDVVFAIRFCFRYLFHPYFVIKCIYKIAKYSGLIYRFNPRVIIVCDEFSFTSSLLTAFCEKHKVVHINVMHGDKLFDITDSYFRFHKCYIWDRHYKKLFIELKADPNQFIVELPLSMSFDSQMYLNSEFYADYKYYLGAYNEDEIASIAQSMRNIRNNGKTVKFRPHPHYSDIELLKKYVDEKEIEYPDVDILVSISNCQNIVGLNSTVLVQAYFNQKCVVLDDVTYQSRLDKLSELDFILSNKVKNRLSELQ